MKLPPAIGLLGGTFDPVHYGHLRAAIEAREALGLETLYLLPCGQPPHRDEPAAPANQRLEMLRLALADTPELRLDDREVRRSGYSYMVDTLAEIRAEAGAAPLVLVIGQDAANGLDRWYEWRRLFDLAHLAVMRRPDARGQYQSDYRGELAEQMARRTVDNPSILARVPAGHVVPIEITQLEISATAIRQLFASGRSARFLLPDAVADHIRRHALYGS